MTIIHRAAIAAVLATCAVAPAIAAGPVRSPVSARISTADLDLTRAAGRAGLHRRLSVAAQRACGLAQAQWHERRDAERCYREMMADGAGKIAALTPSQRLELASIERR